MQGRRRGPVSGCPMSSGIMSKPQLDYKNKTGRRGCQFVPGVPQNYARACFRQQLGMALGIISARPGTGQHGSSPLVYHSCSASIANVTKTGMSRPTPDGSSISRDAHTLIIISSWKNISILLRCRKGRRSCKHRNPQDLCF